RRHELGLSARHAPGRGRLAVFNYPKAALPMSHHDLAGSQVRPPQRRQAEQMQAIGRLSGGVAHDFNNLLTIINGYTELLTRRTAADDPLRPMLEERRRAGREATQGAA